MRTIEHSTLIEAPTSTVWKVLVDTAAYGEWNPFITDITGPLVAGRKFRMSIHPGAREMTFRPTVLAVEVERRIRWRGRLGVPGIFDGEHELLLESLGAGATRFTQSEAFRGVLVPFLPGVLRDTKQGFADMNEALRVRVTNLPSTEPTEIGQV